MSEKKKGKQRKPVKEDPTKEEYAVAKYLRFGLPVREGKLHGMEVKCFIGSAAVDKLMESKWSITNNKKDPLFISRVSCVSYMVGLLQKGLFHRAERDKKKKDKDKEKSKRKKRENDGDKEETAKPDEELRERKGKKERKAKKEKEGEANTEDAKDSAEKKTEKKDEKKKKERRFKLLMPEEQFFEDGDEVYVWIYDPVNAKNFLIGLMMVLGAIGLCMFPLWPEEVRVGVYYLSLSAAGFVGFILFLAVVRLILFCIIWGLTMGKHHFWFLPNLTEDVGFFDSFRPLYHHEKVTGGDKSKEGTKKKKKKKATESSEDSKESAEKKEKGSDKEDSDEFEVIKKEEVSEQEPDATEAQENEDTAENGGEEEEEENNESLEEDEDDDDEEEEEDSQKDEEEKKTK